MDITHPFGTEETWDEHMEFYAKHVGLILEKRKNQPFTNGRPFHAVYLIYQFLMHAQHEVRIFSGRLPRQITEHERDRGLRVYGNPHVLDAAKRFLGKSGTSLRIMVEKDIDGGVEHHPLVEAILELKKRGQLKGQASLRQLSEAEANELAEDKTNHHMLLMDDSGYRWENEPGVGSAKAFVNVNEKKLTGMLVDFFDNTLWHKGSELWSIKGGAA